MMRRLVIFGIACGLVCVFLACGIGSSHPRTPKAVVQELFARIQLLKAAKQTADKGSTEPALEDPAEAKAAVDDLFLNPDRGKLIMMPLMFLDLEDVVFLDEKIDGMNAEVTIEHTVVGIGQFIELQESAQKRTTMTFQLKKVEGRWLISDIGGILSKFGG
jgi:hypothetical protein